MMAGKDPAAIARSPLPDMADIIFLIVIMMLVNLLPNFVLADGSTGWHIVTGQYILSHGQIPHTDLLSYNFSNRAWVPYEWLADLTFAALHGIGGLKLLAVTADCAIALLFALLYYQCRKEGCHIFISCLLVTLGMLTSTIHWLARPHIFTFFGVLIFSRSLEYFRQGKLAPSRLLLILFGTMIVWSNAHPAFLVGFALVIIYMACEALVALLSAPGETRQRSTKNAGILALVLSSTVAASFINANAAHLYSYIFQYLGHTTVLAQTNEFMQPDFKQLHAICMLLLLFLFAVGLLLSKRKPALAPFMMVLAFAYLAFTGMRNEPLFVIVSLPVTAWLYAEADLSFLIGQQAKAPLPKWLEKPAACWHRLGDVDAVEAACNMHILPIAAAIVLVVACFNDGKVFGYPLVTAEFDPSKQPTDTLKAMMQLPEKGGFNLDNWGGYIRYKTGRRVFIDDRLDFYGQDMFVDYGHIIQLGDNWRQLLDKYKINWVLMPKNSVMALQLAESPDWETKAKDEAAILVVRKTPL